MKHSFSTFYFIFIKDYNYEDVIVPDIADIRRVLKYTDIQIICKYKKCCKLHYDNNWNTKADENFQTK